MLPIRISAASQDRLRTKQSTSEFINIKTGSYCGDDSWLERIIIFGAKLLSHIALRLRGTADSAEMKEYTYKEVLHLSETNKGGRFSTANTILS